MNQLQNRPPGDLARLGVRCTDASAHDHGSNVVVPLPHPGLAPVAFLGEIMEVTNREVAFHLELDGAEGTDHMIQVYSPRVVVEDLDMTRLGVALREDVDRSVLGELRSDDLGDAFERRLDVAEPDRDDPFDLIDLEVSFVGVSGHREKLSLFGVPVVQVRVRPIDDLLRVVPMSQHPGIEHLCQFERVSSPALASFAVVIGRSVLCWRVVCQDVIQQGLQSGVLVLAQLLRDEGCRAYARFAFAGFGILVVELAAPRAEIQRAFVGVFVGGSTVFRSRPCVDVLRFRCRDPREDRFAEAIELPAADDLIGVGEPVCFFPENVRHAFLQEDRRGRMSSPLTQLRG